MLLWTNWSNPEDRPLYSKRDEWVEKFGEARADWMLRKSRNLCLYPNVYLMDQFSSQIRVVRPISVNKSEATIYCIAPEGRGRRRRAQRRLRQYEDFFNATGMATPDDLEEFRSCQQRLRGARGASGTTCAAARCTGSRARRQRRPDRPEAGAERHQDRGRGPVHRCSTSTGSRR
mgnify:CR=1 FL=1